MKTNGCSFSLTRCAGEGPSHRSETAEWPQTTPESFLVAFIGNGIATPGRLETFFDNFLWDPTEYFACLLSDTAFIPNGVGMGNMHKYNKSIKRRKANITERLEL